MLHLSGKSDNEMWGPIVVRRSAVGLILGTGTVGTYVANTNPNMVSVSGGKVREEKEEKREGGQRKKLI